jgi:hypothetical protein
MPDRQRKITEDVGRVSPAVYTAAEYDVEITVVNGPARHGKACRALFLPTENGRPMTYEWDAAYETATAAVEPCTSLEGARQRAREALFRRWDYARVKALGSAGRYNASREEWEKLQTFREKVVFPGAARQKLRRALAARGRAEEAARRAAQATKEAVEALCEIGMSYADVGGLLGITKMRVCQILREQARREGKKDTAGGHVRTPAGRSS